MNNINIELRNIDKIKNGNIILKDINLKFFNGQRHILIGPSGAGKTTLLRLLNRLDDPTKGEIIIDGENIKDIPVLKLRRRVGMVFQIPVIFEGKVRDNLRITHDLGISADPPDENELENALTLSGLKTEYLNRNASELSVGEKQRVNIARTLLNNPEVLLLDEPTSALDRASAINLLESIKGLNKELSITIIMVTHQLEFANYLGGNIIQVEKGAVVYHDSSENFFKNSISLYK